MGPRQSGKTTLARAVFSRHTYISLEELDNQRFATDDPRRFLELYKNDHGIILDEIQRVPTLLSYIQTYVDVNEVRGYFILMGSQNFLVAQAVSQTLAGRISIFMLLPCFTSELSYSNYLPMHIDEAIFRGSYPRPYAYDLSIADWTSDYIVTYLERDVRLIKNVSDPSLFKKFVQLCAGRIGQLLSLSALALECGISVPTVKQWISLLEASYILFLVYPYFKNFGKRLVKTPKLYFYDTAIACSLLNIDSPFQVGTHYLRGGLVESYIMSDLYKQLYNNGRKNQLYFWRDNVGHVIDCIIERADMPIPLEIKSGQTIDSGFFEGIKFWKDLTKITPLSFVMYGGDKTQERAEAKICSWKDTDYVLKQIFT